MAKDAVARIAIDVGVGTNVDDMANTPQILENWLIDSAGINRVRPGLATYPIQANTGESIGQIIGSCEWKGDLILVSDDRRIWRVPLAAPNSAFPLSDGLSGSSLAGSLPPVFAGDSLRLIIAGGGALQQWDGSVLSTRLVASGTYPAFAATHVASLANYVIANDRSLPDTIHWSEIGDPDHTVWNALSYTTADARPDRIVALAENVRELLVWGEQTLQAYGISDDYLLPFTSVVTLNVGCIAPYSPIRLDEAFAWLDDRRRFVMGSGHETPAVISGDIAKTLLDLSSVSDCWGCRVDIGYWNLLCWFFPTDKKAFFYDYQRKKWTQAGGTDAQGQIIGMPVRCYAPWTAANKHIFAGVGQMVEMSTGIKSDVGEPITAVRRTGWLNYGSDKRKRLRRLRLTIRRGGSGTTPALFEVRSRCDGGAWNDWTQIGLGSGPEEDAADSTRDVFVAGVFRRQQFEFRYTSADGSQDFSFAGAEAHLTELES